MRIAIIDTTLTTAPTGGCQTFLASLAPALVRRGHEVSIVTELVDETTIADQLSRAGVRVFYDVWPRRFLPEERGRRLAQWCWRESVDSYVVSVSNDAGWLALPHIERTTRTVAIVHSDGPAFYAPLRHYALFVDRAVGVSSETWRSIQVRCGVPEARARRIPYGIDRLTSAQLAERLRLERSGSSRALEVAYIGRLVHSQKRVMDLAPLARELASRRLPVVVNVIGGGEDAPRLREQLQRDGLSGSVRWWGWLEPHEVRERLTQLDALLLFSDVEGLPLSLLEAMGHGVVPIVTRIPSGNAELVRDGENGFLAPVGDSKRFADCIEELYRDRLLLTRLRQKAWATSGRYTVDAMASAYENCLIDAGELAPRPVGSFPLLPSCRSRYPTWLRRLKWLLTTTHRRRRPGPSRQPGSSQAV